MDGSEECEGNYAEGVARCYVGSEQTANAVANEVYSPKVQKCYQSSKVTSVRFSCVAKQIFEDGKLILTLHHVPVTG